MMIKPYFETENGKLYHGDCLEIMPEFKDNEFDLVLTDPPYGIKDKITSGGETNKKIKLQKGLEKWDSRPTKKYFKELFRISKNQIIFGGNYFPEYLFHSRGWVVWDKQFPVKFSYAKAELAFTSFNRNLEIIRLRPECNKEHPIQKPVGLFKQILLKYAEKGQSICDPYAGSGTTALACEAYGFKWVCIEKEQDYCDIIVKRLKLETQQIKLFN